MTENELLISRVPLFATLPPDEIAYLAKSLRVVDIPPGSVVFNEGDPGEHFYIVRDGEIEIVKNMGRDDERIVGIRQQSDFVGEMSLFNVDGRRTASVRSRAGARLWEMTRPEFDALLQRHPLLAYEMVRVLSKRLTNAHNHAIADLTEKNRQLQLAYEELKAAQQQIIEKEKLERELQLAAQIQMSLLPSRLPTLPGFDFGARMVPARAVGGDLYDFIPLDESAVGIVVGDVSDKGVPAAIFMSQTHALIRAEAQRNASPYDTLSRVNSLLSEMNASGLFVTVLYGVLNGTTREFRYARAGHELPLVREPSGAVSAPPHAGGAPLAVLDTVILDEGRLHLAPGATMLLYTDGVTEARDASRAEFGSEGLEAALASTPLDGAQQLCDNLLAQIDRHRAGAPVHDDITLVAVRAL